MGGYSTTPLAKKLGIRSGDRVGLLGAPIGIEKILEPLPSGTTLIDSPTEDNFSVLLVFAITPSELASRFEQACNRLIANGGIWLAWPKKASLITSELDFNQVQRIGLDAGLVDNKVCAIDQTWSGLRMVVRKENRKDWPR